MWERRGPLVKIENSEASKILAASSSPNLIKILSCRIKEDGTRYLGLKAVSWCDAEFRRIQSNQYSPQIQSLSLMKALNYKLIIVSSREVPTKRRANHLLQVNPNFILVDDNVRPHRPLLVDEFLERDDIRQIDWLALSTDLNIIEQGWRTSGTLWILFGIVAKVYSGGRRHFRNYSSLVLVDWFGGVPNQSTNIIQDAVEYEIFDIIRFPRNECRALETKIAPPGPLKLEVPKLDVAMYLFIPKAPT
ncbi:hypothetical protein TNCV_1617191 [Trichonephila clavipes]|nr:hypothetical protein TNCV_1617191 [Trichonephila clavipes]